MDRSIDDHWQAWVSHYLGTGYGTGEYHTIGALRTFLENCKRGEYVTAYDFREIEPILTPATFWLLVELLYRANAIEWGTSARFGWLTKQGEALRNHVVKNTVDHLYDTAMKDDVLYCSPDYCNCEKETCDNPFW